MQIVLSDDDLLIVSFEYPKDADPVATQRLEIDRSLKAERPHQRVPHSQERGNPGGLLREDVSRKRLDVIAAGFRQIHRKRIGEISPTIE